jgi:protein O-GlcNAcase / histone acetyltransferase
VTNEVYQHLRQPSPFFFCPTEYCASRAVPTVNQSKYLDTVGSKLLPDIEIMWTGPKVISRRISASSIEEVARVMRRPPLIWDNIHANDYDPKRLFLGPYDGRSPKLVPYVRGVLTNPNCEFESNFVALHTLAQWSRTSDDSTSQGKKDFILSE